jgi:hypothetical protein
MKSRTKAVFIKNKALCADGVIRPVYSQLTPNRLKDAELYGFHVGHVKVGMVSVSGEVHFVKGPFSEHGTELYTDNLFEAYREGRNADLIGAFWIDLVDENYKTPQEILQDELNEEVEEFVNGPL